IEPHNYGGNFSGPRTLREALANSKNLPALYLTAQLGENKVLNHLHRLGFSSLDKSPEYYGVGITLGNGEVTLWEMAQAYSILARQGVLFPLKYLTDIPTNSTRMLSPYPTFLIADVLSDANARQEEFGRFGPLEFDFTVAAKTGTSNDFRDNWVIGFTGPLTVALWRGNADSSPMKKRPSASEGSGPLFHQIMELAHKYRTPKWPAQPEGIEKVAICPVSGQKPGKYCPHQHFEYALKGHAPQTTCEYHQQIVVADCQGKSEKITYVQYPSFYKEWAQSPSLPTLKNQLWERCHTTVAQWRERENGQQNIYQPRIIEPLSNTTFAIDPAIPKEHQQLRLLFRAVGKKSKILINNQEVSDWNGDPEYYWKLQKGHFNFQLMEGAKVSNLVRIQVL
ncbi:MAG: penicillin-binding transpeptidase domain-containing protein, partial [Pseudomonadota bacterium]